MVLNEKRTTVAYRCPHCGGGIMSAVGLFNLSADMVKLKCTCGESELKIVYNRDGTVRLTVPCLICSQPHTFTVNASLFFSDELFVLPCPYSDINIAFTGEMNTVKAELARTELELLDMLEENGINDFSALHGDEKDLGDPQILDIVLFVIDDLDAEGKIYCRCHPDPADSRAETSAVLAIPVICSVRSSAMRAAASPLKIFWAADAVPAEHAAMAERAAICVMS